MWERYTRPRGADNDWFIIRTEDASDGRITLVLVDWVAGQQTPEVTRCTMAPSDAEAVAADTAAGLVAEGWVLDAEPAR